MTSQKHDEKGQKDNEDIDVDDLLSQLSAEELEMLSQEVDPDDQFVPPDQRSNYHCDRKATGKMDKKHLSEHISKMALETPDQPENVPFTSKKPSCEEDEVVAIPTPTPPSVKETSNTAKAG